MEETDLAWIAAELACELNRIRCEERMSINAYREALKDIPGGSSMTMRYGDGGRTQIFRIGDDEVEVGPEATASDIRAALTKKKVQPFPIHLAQLRKSQV
jgi:hypothetical protein